MNRSFHPTAALLAIFIIGTPASAQIIPLRPHDRIIEPYRLFITYNKTTNLVFPYPVKSVDRGSQDVLAQKARNTENVLLLKAGRTGFTETNLSVITSDGMLYSYVLNYSDTPAVLNVSFDDRSTNGRRALISGQAANSAELEAAARKAAAVAPAIRRLRSRSGGVQLKLEGIYIQGEVMFLRFLISNNSAVGYDVSQFRLVIRDQRKVRRTAVQEQEIEPVMAYSEHDKIKGGEAFTVVYAVPKFTIPDKKYLSIQMMETNGGRTIDLPVHNKTVVRAKALN